ncbi:MAG: hypothetical protein IJ343_13370 [Clostridia bacterium]|nr:hypothetical protein [Clostridia bacterium]
MEKMICSCCGAAIVPTTTQAFLTCAYCDASIANPYYDEAAAAEAARPDLKAICLKTLIDMGESENLDSVDPDCFGNPIYHGDGARSALSIPDSEQMYFLYAHTILLLGFSEGLALTDGGLYYSCGGEKGSRSWEAFITGAISCVDRADKQDGVLRIGSAIEIAVNSDKDSRLARFLVDFHNHVYALYTGSAAPAAWAVTEQSAAAAAQNDDPSLLETILPAVGALLGGSSLLRTTADRRKVTMRPTGRPTILQDRRDMIEPPRPLHSQPHHRPAHPAKKALPTVGFSTRPGAQRKPGEPGAQRAPIKPTVGFSTKPGAQRRPDGPAAQRAPIRPTVGFSTKPGAQRKPGEPAAQRTPIKPTVGFSTKPGAVRPGNPGSQRGPGTGFSTKPGAQRGPGKPGGRR